MENKKILLVDGNSLFFKSFYASYFRLQKGEERTEDGEPINAVRLFSFMIINLVNLFPESKILVAFDAKGAKTYRHQYDFYKGTRKKQPEELYQQIPVVKEFLDIYGIYWMENPNYEADDLIGIYAKYGKEHGYKVNIITSDRDLLQLVDENVDVHLSKTGVTDLDSFTNENFYQKYHGLSPFQIADLKGLVGDSSDNLKGINGIGEKTAVKLLKEYNQLENVIANVDDLTPKLRDKILVGKDEGLLSKHLATIIQNGDFEIDLNQLTKKKEDRKELKDFFIKKNIFNILKKF